MHRVIAWEAVGEVEGTGIVHIAPGCGKEDFLLGKEEKLPPLAPLDDYGAFLPGFGELEGKSAIDSATTDWILNNLQQKGILLAAERYPHSYPHCWRCKTELLFRLVDEWFINMSWRNEIIEVTDEVEFLPESINGRARERDWLKNMGDWMISKKRFWGLALPIWVCEKCGQFDVISGREELKQRAVAGWDQFNGHSPHRPWIDLVKIRCDKCGGTASRIGDVGNPWLDAGIVPFSTLKYNTDRGYWQKWFPADFITESFPGQFRNWFYAILAMSTMLEHKAPMKVLLGHAQVRDEKGEEMHKSKGNAIPFEEAAEKISADLMRWMFCRQNPSNNINFGYGPADEIRNKFVLKLWNTYAFFCNYARLDGFDPTAPQVPIEDRPDIDRWILSDLQILIQTARREFERFNVQAFCKEAEDFVDNRLSNWYVRRNRRRFWKSEKSDDKQAAYQTLHTVLTTLAKLLAPIMPFLTEAMYQNLMPTSDASIHHCEFPEPNNKILDEYLLADMQALLRIVALGSAARNSVKIKVRQPLAELKVFGDQNDRKAVEKFGDQICEELNVKKVTLVDQNNPLFVRKRTFVRPETVKFEFGSKAGLVLDAVRKLSQGALQESENNKQPIKITLASGDEVLLPSEHIDTAIEGVDGWSVIQHLGTCVGVDTRISLVLKQEGQAREVVRHVQNARKDAGLEMEDRIVLYLHIESKELREAVETHKEYICRETLAVKWATQPLGEGAYRATVKVDGQPLTIELSKIS
jgi:isoleucyl-tRNA synthetase